MIQFGGGALKTTDLREGELALICGTFLFQGQPEERVLDCICQECATREEFRRGSRIYTPESFRRSLGILCAGRVEVSKGELVLSSLSPGELFGAAALFTDRAFATTLTATTRCAVVFLPQELVSRAMAGCPGLAANYIRYLSGRIHFLNEKIDSLIVPGARQKLSRCLLAQTGELDCSATGLARRLDVSRASLYRAFEALEEAGAIERRGKLIRVTDRDALIQLSQN